MVASLGTAVFNLTVQKGWDPKNRPSWDEMFLSIADMVSFRGTCPARRVGAVITLDNYVIATGYNGAPRGLMHCSEAGCSRDANGRCTRAVHAEVNALLQAARRSGGVAGGVMYSTDRPCLNCSNAIIQAGISRVVYWHDDLESKQRLPALEALRIAGLAIVEAVPFSYVQMTATMVQ